MSGWVVLIIAFGAFFGVGLSMFVSDKLGATASTVALAALVGSVASIPSSALMAFILRRERRATADIESTYGVREGGASASPPPNIIMIPQPTAPSAAPPLFEKGLGAGGAAQFDEANQKHWRVL